MSSARPTSARRLKPSTCINLDTAYRPSYFGAPIHCTDFDDGRRSEVVGTKTATELESDFLARFNKSQPQGRPKGGLTVEEMAKAANVGHASIRKWLAKQKGYKSILGTKQYATRKQVVTYYVKQ